MLSASSMSENAQMYLVSILRLGEAGRPVPLSQLASTLDVSAVSVNQMCRRLQDEGVVIYVPYEGVSFTEAGHQLASRILRRHRLWEVFLVERLRMRSGAAHEMACRLEHATSGLLAQHLAAFLSHPQVNPDGEPIPDSSGRIVPGPAHSLADMRAGQMGRCLRCSADQVSCAFLGEQGLNPGSLFRVVATAPSSLLLELEGNALALQRNLAAAVSVEMHETEEPPIWPPTRNLNSTEDARVPGASACSTVERNQEQLETT